MWWAAAVLSVGGLVGLAGAQAKWASPEGAAARSEASGASQSDVDGYEAADPSYMAVGAAIRYWKKYHPEAL